jgi:hypothetical protein
MNETGVCNGSLLKKPSKEITLNMQEINYNIKVGLIVMHHRDVNKVESYS